MNLKAENLNKIDSIIDLIGNTPLIKLNQFSELSSDKKIYIKAEWFNPGGSIKDRAALSMIKEGIKKGSLTKEKTIMDSSSGNTAIAYAMIGSALGFKVELVTPENINIERGKLCLFQIGKAFFDHGHQKNSLNDITYLLISQSHFPKYCNILLNTI